MPPVSADYKPTGSYETVTDLKTYVVGPKDAQKAVIVIYDVFGLAPQALQGMPLPVYAGLLGLTRRRRSACLPGIPSLRARYP